ncbi:GYD domain-containing protein [Natrialbaceae archaeon A-gly3]
MPTYVLLFEKTDDGRTADFEEIQTRRERGVELAEKHGGEVEALYYSHGGPYDFVAIAEFPDSEAAAKAGVAYEKMGLATSKSFEVFGAETWDSILEDALE